MLLVACYSLVGIVVGVVFTLLFINFDKAWKKFFSYLFGFGGTSGGFVAVNTYLNIESREEKMLSIVITLSFFMLSFVCTMLIMCKLIKDKDDSDVLRIRDILLGQKAYIDKYYEGRKREIDQKLGIPLLEAREQKIQHYEDEIEEKRKFIEQEQQKLESLGSKKLKMELPDKQKVIVSERFLETLPSYIDDFAKCINDLKRQTELFLENKETCSQEELIGYLVSISLIVSQYLFGGSTDIRVHFRYYSREEEKYVMLLAITGAKTTMKKMTPIPFENSMIKKSYECKRAMIKSINSESDYRGNNYTTWKDYMTFTFYSLTKRFKEGILPFLSFGISVKNEVRYKELFYFLSFVSIESYLNEYIESIDTRFDLKAILYRGDESDE